MTTIEILAGSGIENAFKSLDIKTKNELKSNQGFGVYKITDDEYKKPCNSPEPWPHEWGWWRFSEGSNMGGVDQEYTINGKKIIAWDGVFRNSLKIDCFCCVAYQDNLCDGSENNRKEFGCLDRSYTNIMSYFNEELGASTEWNVCSLAVDLARQNGMTMAELFNEYM